MWPAPGELAGLRRRAQLGAELVDRGRHAPGERVLRQAAASLARRSDWTHASQAALALGWSIARRGRSKDAQRVLSDAREYASRDGNEQAMIDVAIRTGHVSIDLARLEDAETTLSVALAAARALCDPGRIAAAGGALARCLFWRGRFADAESLANGVNTESLGAAATIRLTIAASRSAVGTRNLAVAVSLAASAVQDAMRLASASSACERCLRRRLRASRGRRLRGGRARRDFIGRCFPRGARPAARAPSAAAARRGCSPKWAASNGGGACCAPPQAGRHGAAGGVESASRSVWPTWLPIRLTQRRLSNGAPRRAVCPGSRCSAPRPSTATHGPPQAEWSTRRSPSFVCARTQVTSRRCSRKCAGECVDSSMRRRWQSPPAPYRRCGRSRQTAHASI